VRPASQNVSPSNFTTYQSIHGTYPSYLQGAANKVTVENFWQFFFNNCNVYDDDNDNPGI